jgi:hypothetical protein
MRVRSGHRRGRCGVNAITARIRVHVGIESHEAWCPALIHKDCCDGECECATGPLGAAILAVLDKCDAIEVDLWGQTYRPGKFIADDFRSTIAEVLGVTTPDSPSGDTAGVRSPDGETTEDGAA